MKILYLDCGMGAAGDMLTAALIELLPDPDAFVAKLNALGLPGVHVQRSSAVKCGITGTHISVTVNGVEEESHDHGVPVTDIHFHEVGTMDAVADVTAVCLLMEELAPDAVVVSPIHVGSGHVRCVHGILPVPAPATAYILRDVPIYGGQVQGELCTPTGAALLKYFATRFGDMPVMKTHAIGYGMGKKDFPMANCVRAMLGETAEAADVVLELACNVDDMMAEAIGLAVYPTQAKSKHPYFFTGGNLYAA